MDPATETHNPLTYAPPFPDLALSIYSPAAPASHLPISPKTPLHPSQAYIPNSGQPILSAQWLPLSGHDSFANTAPHRPLDGNTLPKLFDHPPVYHEPSIRHYQAGSSAQSSQFQGNFRVEVESRQPTSELPSPIDSTFKAGHARTSTNSSAAQEAGDIPAPAKPKKSHARKQPAGHIPRPRNAFILFRKHITDNNLIPTTVEVKHQNISIVASKMWSEAPAEVKAEFNEAARIEKEEHTRLYPNYRYQPAYRRTDIVRRRVRKDPNEDEKCDAVANLLIQGKAGEKLETEIKEQIAAVSPEVSGPAAVKLVVKRGRRRRKEMPGEQSKGAVRAQKAQARARAMRESWAESGFLIASSHQADLKPKNRFDQEQARQGPQECPMMRHVPDMQLDFVRDRSEIYGQHGQEPQGEQWEPYPFANDPFGQVGGVLHDTAPASPFDLIPLRADFMPHSNCLQGGPPDHEIAPYEFGPSHTYGHEPYEGPAPVFGEGYAATAFPPQARAPADPFGHASTAPFAHGMGPSAPFYPAPAPINLYHRYAEPQPPLRAYQHNPNASSQWASPIREAYTDPPWLRPAATAHPIDGVPPHLAMAMDEATHFPPDYAPVSKPSEIIAGYWQRDREDMFGEGQPYRPLPDAPLAPAGGIAPDDASALIPYIEPVERSIDTFAHPTDGIDFGHHGELFDGELFQDKDVDLQGYEKALRHNQDPVMSKI